MPEHLSHAPNHEQPQTEAAQPTPEQAVREAELWAQVSEQAALLNEQLVPLERHKKVEYDKVMAWAQRLARDVQPGQIDVVDAKHAIGVINLMLDDQQNYDKSKRQMVDDTLVLPMRAAVVDQGITEAQRAAFGDALQAIKESMQRNAPQQFKQQLTQVSALISAQQFDQVNSLLRVIRKSVLEEAGSGEVEATKLGKVLATFNT